MQTNQKHYRKRAKRLNRGRLTTVILSLTILISLIGSISIDFVSNRLSLFHPDDQKILTVIVRPGDTLWHLASAATFADEDVRNKVIVIRTLNRLSANHQLIPGQFLQIPVKSDSVEYILADRQ